MVLFAESVPLVRDHDCVFSFEGLWNDFIATLNTRAS